MASLQEQATVLLDRWRQEIQRLPLPAHIQVVGGEAGENMARITGAILEVVDDAEAAALFEAGGEAYRSAQELGRIRKQQSFSIEELVQEHIILRNEFWNVFRERVDMKHVVDFHLEKRVNGCFDVLLQAAASSYQYEYSKDIMENPLRDPVTGLYNKSYFHGRLIEELRRSVRYNHDITLVLFEMDNYYNLQDLEGEEKIRVILKAIAAFLPRMTRDCDVVARMGEGGFAVLLPETGWRGGKIMAERLHKCFTRELPTLVCGENAPEFRWGLASFPEEVRLPEKLYACAVEAMRYSGSLAPGEVAVYHSYETREGD
jgi:diguanylate cyclase (GGDEF)-like protein